MSFWEDIFSPSPEEQFNKLKLKQAQDEENTLLRAQTAAPRLLQQQVMDALPTPNYQPVPQMSLPTPNYKPVPQIDPNTGAVTPGTSAPDAAPTANISPANLNPSGAFLPQSLSGAAPDAAPRMGAMDPFTRAKLMADVQGGPLAYMQSQIAAQQPSYTTVPDVGLVNTHAPGGPKTVIGVPAKPTALPDDIQGYNQAKAQGFQGTFVDYKTQLAQAGRPPTVAATKPVFDNTLKTTRMATDAEIAANPGNFSEPPPQKPYGYDEKQADKAKADDLAYTNADADLQRMVDSATSLRDDPNLSKVTGTFNGGTPNLSQGAVNTQAKIDNLMSQTVLQAIQSARAGSQSGATGFGALSEKELGVLQDKVANLRNTRQGTPQYKTALQLVIDYGTTLQKNLKTARGGAVTKQAVASSGAQPSIQDLVDKYRSR